MLLWIPVFAGKTIEGRLLAHDRRLEMFSRQQTRRKRMRERLIGIWRSFD
jgi:hypothetical protein